MLSSFRLPRISMIFMVIFSVVLAATTQSCEDSFLAYNITIINNTTSDLNIYEKGINSSFHKIGDVDAQSSATEKGFVIDVDYTLEVRKVDGTVVQTRVFNQTNDSDRDWTIN